MDDSQGFAPALTREVAMKQQAKVGAMTEAMDEHVKRAAKAAGHDDWSADQVRDYIDVLGRSHAARSILAHAETLAASEAREAEQAATIARLRKLVVRAQIVGADDLPEQWHTDARTALEDQHG